RKEMDTGLFVRRGGREFLEHFHHALVEVIDVLFGLIGERVAGRAAPDEFFCCCIRQVDDKSSYPVRLWGCSGVTKSAETPASAEVVVKGVERLLIMGNLDGHDGDIP